jgi:hypothetical protein
VVVLVGPAQVSRVVPTAPAGVRLPGSCFTDRVKLPPTASYSLRRLGLFVATLGVSTVIMRGVNFFFVLLFATLVSGVLSFVLLSGSREQMARSVAGRIGRLNQRLDAGAAREDAALDAAEAAKRAPEQ